MKEIEYGKLVILSFEAGETVVSPECQLLRDIADGSAYYGGSHAIHTGVKDPVEVDGLVQWESSIPTTILLDQQGRVLTINETSADCPHQSLLYNMKGHVTAELLGEGAWQERS